MSQNPPSPDGWQPQSNASGSTPTPYTPPATPYTPPATPYGQPPTSNTPQPTPTYGTPAQPYGAPPPAAPQPAYGVPPQPAYGQPTPGYGYSAPGQYGYGQQQPQWGQPAYPTPSAGYGYEAKPKSAVLGLISLLLVLGCGVALSVLLWQMGSAIGPLMTSLDPEATQAQIQAQIQTELMATLGAGQVAALNFCFIGGLVGWILGIVATATRRGRAFGVWAIVVGIFAPFIAGGFMVAALSAYLQR